MSTIPTASPRPVDAGRTVVQELRVLVWPIDPGNPYTVALHSDMGQNVTVEAYAPQRLTRRYDIWHIHWPESLLNIRSRAKCAIKLAVFLSMIDSVRLRGGRIVWTLHNLKAHDALHPALEAWFYRRFLTRVDGIISLSRTGLEMARDKFPHLRSLPAVVIPHGHYRGQYPPCREDARVALNVSAGAKVILFFGEVRDYKNVEALVRAFRGVEADGAMLVVAGRPKSAALAESIVRAAEGDSRVRLQLKFIPDEDVARYFEAADLVVLPYRAILNSGAALLALSFHRPVLVPDMGAMGDLRADIGPDWVRTYSGEIDAARLEDGLSWATCPRPSFCNMPRQYEWNDIRSETVRFYSKLIHEGGSRKLG
jgi:beta-1,4-mannosyltransferase